jgi:hypothetical protein
MKLKWLSVAVVLSTLLAATVLADERGILLRTSFVSAANDKKPRQPKPKRSRFVEPDFTTLSAPGLHKNEIRRIERTLTAALFDDTVLHIALEGVERNAVDVYVWSGRIEGDDSSSVSISVKDRAMVASIATRGQRYMIEPAENGAHEAFELDAAEFPNESEPRPASPATARGLVTVNDNGATIDVLVLYTDDLRAILGGTAAAQAAASSAIAATNTAYQNSGIVPRVRLAGTSEVQYTEVGDIGTALDQLSNPSDGIMDQVHTLRDQLGADDVSLLVVNGGSACGIAYLLSSFYITNPQYSFATAAFNVVDNDCAVGNLSFPHELGHNFGLMHDRFVSAGSTPSYPYAFGYVDTQNQFRDIMSYVNACGSCPRIQYFSSPNLTYLGRPLGVSYESSPSTSADNVRALNNNASLISNWRQSVAAPTFTDDPLVAGGTLVREVHVTELRTAINNYRAQASLGAYGWGSTITAGTTAISAAQISELRTALTPALTAFSRTASYTNPLALGDLIQTIDIQELRNYLK